MNDKASFSIYFAPYYLSCLLCVIFGSSFLKIYFILFYLIVSHFDSLYFIFIQFLETNGI